MKVYTDPGYHAFCAVSEHFNCETVATSPYAVFAGLPVALWGLAGYLFMGGLCLWGMVRRNQQESSVWPFGLLFWLSLFSFLISVVLFAVSHHKIQSLCLLCIATYGVNLLLWSLAVLELLKLKGGPLKSFQMDATAVSERWRPLSLYLASFMVTLAVLRIAVPAYWEVDITTGPGGLLVGQTAEGHGWIGARQPVLEIVEFSDYQCPHCSRGHQNVRSLVRRYPDKIRLVHRHYPLRAHRYAYAYAVMAYCAGNQKRFWEANDYLYSVGRRSYPVSPEELAEAIGMDHKAMRACMVGGDAKSAVLQDITAGRDIKLKGTPTYVIGDRTYSGNITEKDIADAIASKPMRLQQDGL